MNVLLSIKPKYVNEILAGKKIFEFRKAIFKKKDIGKVFIYSSSPVKKIVASFEIARIIADSPKKIWDKCHEYGGIPENDFFDYYQKSDVAYAIEISNLDKFSKPIDPYKLKNNFRPPQSYCYLPLDYFDNKSFQNTSGKEYETIFLAEENEEYESEISVLDEEMSHANQLSESTKRKIGWIEEDLLTLSNKITDGSHNPPKKSEFGKPMLSAQNIFDDKILFEGYRLIKTDEFEKECQRANVESGDVLLTIVGTIGRSIVVPDKIRKFTIQRSVALIKPKLIDSQYLSFYLRSPKSQLYFQHNSKGTAQKGIYLNSLRKLPVSLAPLPEQRAIVSKIELLFSELDNGIANLKLAQEQLKVYRQAVLKKAFEGELTRKWREQQAELPSADELVERIKVDREEKYNRKLDEWKKAVYDWEDSGKEGKKPAKPRKAKQIEPLTESEVAKLPNLHDGWAWIKFIEFCSIQRGYDLPLKNIVEGVYPVITSGGFAGYHEEYRATGPCLVTGRSGSVGNIHFMEVEKYWPHNTVLFVKDFHGNYPKFVYYFFLQFNFKSFSASTAVPTLDRKMLYNELVRLPCYEEQQAIVTEIETRLSVCDKVEQDIADNLEKAEALRQSILKKAFEGKLLSVRELEEVRNAPDWEPAEKLLERVKAGKQ